MVETRPELTAQFCRDARRRTFERAAHHAIDSNRIDDSPDGSRENVIAVTRGLLSDARRPRTSPSTLARIRG
jgi:hypothetical protein